jgi:hypothetical protein
MRRKPGIAGGHDGHAIRLAWWASFFATVALIALLGVARSAQALTVPAPTGVGIPAPASDDEVEVEDEEGEEEAGEAEECEAGEEFEEECEGGEVAGVEAPEECLLSSASATVSASTASDRLRLAVRYTTFAPATVGVTYWLRGAKGPLSFGGDHAHFALRGVFRQAVTLSDAQMTKVAAAKDFTVQLRPAGAPAYCHHYLDRHLTIRHTTRGALTWSSPEASLRR